MNKKILLVMLLIVVSSYIFYTHRFSSQLTSTSQPTSTPKMNQPVQYKVETVETGLKVPWSIVFTSEDRILVTERPGVIRQIVKGTLDNKPLITFPEVSSVQEEGLMGLEKDPSYKTNHYLYAAVAYPKNNSYLDKIVRLKDNQSSITVDKILLDTIPAAQVHAGSRVKFGPDGKLYITTGDATDKSIPQDLNSLGGKILRMNSDGTIPSDNPFPDSYVYSYGHRNSQGMAWMPNGNMYEVEHGPSGFDGSPGGDEINHIIPKGNYGWPLVSHTDNKSGMIAPLQVYTPAIAPGALMIYSGKIFGQFKNQLFYSGLVGKGLFHAVIDANDSNKIDMQEKFGDINVGRIRDVIEGPDGYIYFTTSNSDGRGTPTSGDDKILRLVPQN